MADHTLTVIILNWNGEHVIGPCLESLQALPEPRPHVMVVDNASTDSSPEIVARDFPQVELIRNDRNLLFAEGNNVGLRRALEGDARFVLLLNNDTEVAPDFISRMLDVFDREPQVGIVGPKILYHDDPQRLWYGGGGFLPVLWIPRHRNIRKLDGTFAEAAGMTAWVSGCALLVRREVLDDIGMLDPSYRIYCEDVDFCLRAVRVGWWCFYEPAARVWHKVSSSSGGGMTPFKLENRLVSTYRLFMRFRPWWWRVLLFPAHAATFVALCGGLLAAGRFRLLTAALRGGGRILRGG
jgi:GT2 family glycosyltransferase